MVAVEDVVAERVGLLVFRAWIEPGTLGLRVPITSNLDIRYKDADDGRRDSGRDASGHASLAGGISRLSGQVRCLTR
jgi:hypothetical protein